MDGIKDTGKGDDFSQFIDAQQVRTDPFGKNRAAERLYRRVERICAALYLLTRHIPEDEPLRVEVRSEGVALFEKVLHLKEGMRATYSSALSEFEASVRRLISLMRILTAGGFVSFQNADTMIGALDELCSFIASAQRSPLSEETPLNREDLLGDTSPLGDRKFLKDIKDKRNIKDITDTAAMRDSPARSLLSGARAQNIIAILQGGTPLGIKDISVRLPDYSEKMIQRELTALIKRGQVKKEGFKRWSRYSLA